MSQLNTDRLKRFVGDEVMSDTVKELLLQTFMKRRQGDVQLKAAQMLAIEMLEDGWKELERYKGHTGDNRTHNRQVGL